MADDLIERLRVAAKIHRDIGGQTALAATIEEAAAALARRVEGARVVTLSRADVNAFDLPDTWSGKRVRLVLDEGGGDERG